MESDSSEPEAKEASSNKKKISAVGHCTCYVGEAGGNECHED